MFLIQSEIDNKLLLDFIVHQCCVKTFIYELQSEVNLGAVENRVEWYTVEPGNSKLFEKQQKVYYCQKFTIERF